MSVHSGKRSATELHAGDEMEESGSVDYSQEGGSNYSLQSRNVRSNSMKGPERNCSEKLIFSRRTFRSSSRTISGTSAVCSSSTSKPNEIHDSHGDNIFPESSSRQTGKMESASRQEIITSESLPMSKATQLTSVELDNHELPKMKECFIDVSQASGSSSASVHSRNYIHTQYRASHSCLSFRSRTSTLKDNLQSSGSGNLGCTSTSDIPSSSTLDHNYRRADLLRARFHSAGNSSHRGMDLRQSSASDSSISSRNLNVSGESLEDQSQIITRRARNQPSNSDRNAVSVRTRRATSRESRMRSEPQDEGLHSLSEPVLDPHIPMTQISFGNTANARAVQASLAEPTPQVHGTLSSTPRHVYSDDRVIGSTDSHGSMNDSHGYQHFAMAEITEVLLALERIERAQRLLSLESNFFFGSLVLRDQHRNMRMDIDSMTYEEILALEEKIGTVSTALSEEMLSKCLKKGIYNKKLLEIQVCSSDDIKCSICQEEYCAGDEIGTLSCGHLYHVDCIQQWLRMKNWCPICKVNVAIC